MKLTQSLFWLFALVTTIHALTVPGSLADPATRLFKRKGGGGGRGGGSSSGGRSSGSSSGLRAGVGPQPRTYGSGAYYPGGSVRPYKSGGRSPAGVAPVFLGVGALALFPGIWLYGAYAYSYPGLYYYHNRTSGQNESHPVQCWCSRYQECACDVKNQTDYLNSIANNNTVARVANVNDTDTLLINGTLPNGTVVAESGAHSFKQGLVEMSGLWVVLAGVIYTIWFF